jgi:translation initiation factor 3 subunit L
MTLNVHSEEGLSTFEELFLYACPKFISANSPPYDDPAALASMLNPPTPTSPTSPTPNVIVNDPTQRHFRAMSSHFLSLTPVPSLKSLLKLYTSLDAQKLTGFLDTSGAGADEEEVLSWMMVMKNAGRCVGRVNTGGTPANGEKDNEGRSRSTESLLDGDWMSISDLNFVIDEVCDFLLSPGRADAII